MTAAWFHCFSGVAGDMALGSLLDAGADAAEVRRLLGRLPMGGWRLDLEATQRCGVGATRAVVVTEATTVSRRLSDIETLLAAAALPARVRDRSIAVFRRLAAVEGAIHRVEPDEVHFHEVGALDAIVDVVGTCAALEVLDVDDITCSPVTVGRGTVRTQHGRLPNPAPATLALLAGRPVLGAAVDLELTTPTGAALVTTLAGGFGPLPPMTVRAVGYGAGGRDLPDQPNVTQVVLGDLARHATPSGQPVTVLEVNVDDVTGEVLAHTVTALLAAGAHDAWITPIIMKKGRPAATVHALCDPALSDQVAATS